MGEPENSEINPIIYFVLVIAILFAIVQIVPMVWQPGSASVHPPQVTISREVNQAWVGIEYDGGIDSAFVGDFTVKIGNIMSYHKNPGVGGKIAEFYLPYYTCVEVKAFDKAVQIYRPIGYRCL